MSDFEQTITSLNLLHTSLYRMELFMNAQAVNNAKTDLISLISRLEKAESERDELRAEIKQRDAAGLEPFAYAYRYAGCETSDGFQDWREELSRERPADWMIETGKVTDLQELHTAAQPAGLPPDWYFQLTFEIPGLDNMTPYQAHGAAWKQCREKAKSLGAQQQKVVELPNGCGERYAWSDGVHNLLCDIKSELDAANVKYEVKQ